MSNQFYFGVVESREDPLMLGRCKVRVFGVHSEDKLNIPTESLPWAIPIQPINSAAMNGIGSNPVGPVEGTWVMIAFLDGEDKQQPIIMGSIGGIPSDRANLWDSGDDSIVMDSATGKTQSQTTANVNSSSGILSSTTTTSNLVDSSGQPVRTGSGGYAVTESTSTSASTDGNQLQTGTAAVVAFKWPWILSTDDIDKLRLKIRFRESTDRYNIINSIGFVGAYQLGAVGLVDLGYVNADIGRSNAKLKQDSYWKGKNGIKSLQNFFDNPSEQDNACRNYFRINFGYLKSKGAINENTTKKELCGLLAAAHLVGAGGASNLVKGNVKKDANGVSAQQYYDLGYSAISGDLPIMPPSTNPAPVQEQTIKETAADKTATSQIETLLKTKFGFKDPNGMYPLLSHIGEPDTNRLARHQNIAETIIPGKIQEQLHSVPMANNRGSWDQSDIPFNAIYPFNHVTETESGHIMEFDDTPGCERINMHHTSGTFSEIDANGTQVNRIVGDSFVIMERHGYVNISGDCIIHVEGNANIYVENDADIQVDGDVLANLNNNLDANVAGKMNLNVTEELQIKAKQINMQTHTGSINFDSAAQINSLAATSIMNQAGSVIRSSASGAIDIQSGEDFSVDAVNVQLNSGTSSAADVGNPATTLLVGNVRADVIAPVFDDLTLPNYIEEKDISVYEDATPAAIDDHIQQKLEKKELSQADFDQMEADKANPPPALKVDSTPTTPQKGIAVPTPASSPDGTYPKSLRISPHYTLQDLTGFAQSPKILVPQHGRSVEQLVANMTALAINCLEPIKKAYPNMKLNSCLRSVGNAFSKSGGTPSQHELGMAADMKFEGYDVYDVVLKLKDLIPYDQLILEYSNNYSSRWIHVSFNSISNRNMNFTMNNGKTFPVPGAKGYKKLA